MAYSGRALSPGSRRIANGARASESTLTTDSGYHSHRHNSYTAPRSNTGGVIPISKETFINIPAPRDPRPAERIDTYSGRPRKSSLVDAYRGSASTSNLLPVRSSGRPNVIQNDIGRSSSPPKSSREKEYYITPASSQEHRGGQHKKLYSIDDGTAKLVADVNIPADRNHRRRESGDRGLYRANGPERDRGRRGYHTIYRDKSIDDDDAFSYTDPAGMYRETEPRWSRPRRGSLDRGGVSRERPTSMIEPDPRRTTINVGPPPSTRGWDKINRSSREVGTSPNRSRGYTDGVFIDVRDPYHIRGTSADRRHPTVHQDRYDGYDYDDRREAPRRYERRNSITRGDRPDRSVERRGFGIRSDSRSNSQNRYRSSDENFEQTRYREAGYTEPRRRETAPPEPAFHDDRRYEQERKDREYAERLQQDEFNRGGYRDETRHHDRGAPRDRDFDVDRERERERIRQMEPPSDRDRHRQESYDRDASRKDSSPPRGSDITSKPSLAQAAVGGLAATAAAAGIAGAVHGGEKRDGERRSNPRTSDERLNREAAERDRLRDGDRGLGFAFEGPPESQRPRGASTSNPERPPERPRDVIPPPAAPRDAEREHEGSRKVEMPAPAIDPDEEYRRRMEQVQRELGAASDTHHSSDSDPDRVRRRREREQRLRGRELENRNGAAAAAVADVRVNGGMPVPQHFARRSHEDEQSMLSANTATTAEQLRRRPSILDRPMTDEPAQIIDNSNSSRHENRVRIVDPPTEEEEKRPKGILKKPTEKFPENPDEVREGVAPMKDSTKKGIPPGAKWTKIDRRLVNPASLDEAGERYEERLDHVIVLRVLTKEDIQKLADRTREIREKAYEEDRKARRRDRDRDRDRRDRDEYSEDDSADEFKKKAPRMLEAPASTVSGGGSSGAGGGGGGSFSDDGTSSREQRRRERERERERERDRDRDRD